MTSLYKIITEGKLRDGIEPEQFVDNFSKIFKVSPDQAKSLLSTSRILTLKDKLDRNTAEKFQRVLQEQVGLIVRIEEMPSADSSSLSLEGHDTNQPETSKPGTTNYEHAGVRCPKCGSDRVSGDDCLACGIIISRYRARKAESATSQQSETEWNPYQASTTNDAEESDSAAGVRAVGAGDAWQWIVGGWRLFLHNPFVWIAIIIIWYVIIFIAGMIPFVGSLAVNIFSPVFMAGLMLGAREQASGGSLTVGHLFEGFSTEFGKLIQAGLLYLAATVGIMIVMGIFLFVFGMGSFLLNPTAAHAASGISFIAIFFMIVIVLIAMAMLGMAFYFVPLLIVFDGMDPVPAMQQSFSACWKNWLAFLVYSLILAGLGILAIIPVGLGFFLLGPVILASIYVSYRHIFHGEI